MLHYRGREGDDSLDFEPLTLLRESKTLQARHSHAHRHTMDSRRQKCEIDAERKVVSDSAETRMQTQYKVCWASMIDYCGQRKLC